MKQEQLQKEFKVWASLKGYRPVLVEDLERVGDICLSNSTPKSSGRGTWYLMVAVKPHVTCNMAGENTTLNLPFICQTLVTCPSAKRLYDWLMKNL